MWKARIRVMLKKGVLDPQGETVRRSLGALGYHQVKEVRVGKYMEVTVDTPDRGDAEAQVDEMCRRLLANPVIEDFAFDLYPMGELACAGEPVAVEESLTTSGAAVDRGVPSSGAGVSGVGSA